MIRTKEEFKNMDIEKEVSRVWKIAALINKYMLPPTQDFPFWEYVGPWPI